MNIMVSELYDALISAGADQAKARRAAEGLADSDQQFKRQFSELREDNQKMRTEMAGLRGELVGSMTSLKGELAGAMAGLKGPATNMITSLDGSLRHDMATLGGSLRHEMQSLDGSLRREVQSLDGSLRSEMQSLRSDVSLVKWMAGVVLGLLIAILLRVYLV